MKKKKDQQQLETTDQPTVEETNSAQSTSAMTETQPQASEDPSSNQSKGSASRKLPTRKGSVSVNKMVATAGIKVEPKSGKFDLVQSDPTKLGVPISYVLLQYFTKDRRDDIVNVPADMITETYQMDFLSAVHTYLNGAGLAAARGEVEAVAQVIREYFASVGGQMYEQAQGDAIPVTEVFERMRSYTNRRQQDEEDGPFLNIRSNLLEQVRAILARDHDDNGNAIPNALPEGFVNHIIELAIQDVERSIVRGVVGPATMRLRAKEALLASGNLVNLTEYFSYQNLDLMVERVQDTYISLVRNKDVNVVGETLQSAIEADRPIAFAMNTISYFEEQASVTVPVRLDYFLAHTIGLHSNIDMSRPYTVNPLVPGLLAEITDFHPLVREGFRRITLYVFLTRIISHFTGLQILDGDTYEQRLRDRLFTQDPDAFKGLLPPIRIKEYELAPLMHGYAPELSDEEFEADLDRLQEMFSLVAMEEFLTLVLRRDSGFLYSRINALLDQRAIDRSTIWNLTIDRTAMGMSMLFQSYLNTFSWFWQLLINPDIRFSDDNALIKKNIIANAIQYSESLKTSTVPSEWASSIKQASLLFDNPYTDTLSVDSSMLPAFVLPDEGRLAETIETRAVIYNPETRDTKTYFLSQILRGSLFYGDHPSVDLHSFPDPILEDDMYDQLDGYYALTRKYPDRELANPMISSIFKYPNITRLFEDGRFVELFMEKCSLSTYKSAYDMATALHLPLEIATDIFNRSLQIGDFNLRAVMEWTGDFEQLLVFRRDLLPVVAIYEYEPEAGTLLPSNDQMQILWPEGMIWSRPNLRQSRRAYVRSRLLSALRSESTPNN